MGIFDFFKTNKKIKTEKEDKASVNSIGTSDYSLSNNKIIPNKASIEFEDKKKIVLDEEEIQKFIDLEIAGRISDEPKFDFNSTEFDPLLKEAARIIVEHQQGSAALLQRKLKLGYNRAGRLIDNLELIGIVGAFDGERARSVNFFNVHELDLFFQQNEIGSSRLAYFKENVLPLHEEYISFKVTELKRVKETAEQNELKEILKQEILNEEKEKLENEKIRELKSQVKKELIEEGIISNLNESDLKRETIPQDILDKVWNRDGGKCVKCGSQEKLEFDHIIPFSKGGSNTYRNLQILCEKCNRQKSNSIG